MATGSFKAVYTALPRTYLHRMTDKIERTDAEWRTLLSPEEYRILREKGTERAFTGHYYKTKEPGTYVCAACGHELFDSDTKYESGSGWPSFFAAKDGEEEVDEGRAEVFAVRAE